MNWTNYGSEKSMHIFFYMRTTHHGACNLDRSIDFTIWIWLSAIETCGTHVYFLLYLNMANSILFLYFFFIIFFVSLLIPTIYLYNICFMVEDLFAARTHSVVILFLTLHPSSQSLRLYFPRLVTNPLRQAIVCLQHFSSQRKNWRMSQLGMSLIHWERVSVLQTRCKLHTLKYHHNLLN